MANIHDVKQADNLEKRRASKRKYIQKKRTIGACREKENATKQKVSEDVDKNETTAGRERQNSLVNIHDVKQADNLEKCRASVQKNETIAACRKIENAYRQSKSKLPVNEAQGITNKFTGSTM